MSREKYQTQLAGLREDVLAMSTLVMERCHTGLDALESRDEALARTLIGSDQEINNQYLDIERKCIDLFALQQPVASDLRFVAASFKISTDLERIGDLVVNLAEYSIGARGEGFPAVNLREIGTVATEMLGDAIDAYANENVWACHEVAACDDELDALCERANKAIVRDLIETEEVNEAATEELLQDVFMIALAIRDLERIGDHAVNIAARTLYMSENDDELI